MVMVMGSETQTVCLIFILLAYELRETSGATRCYECGTIFTPYCEDPLFLKGTLTYKPTLCKDLIKDDVFASKVITMFMTYMTDSTEEMEGTNSLSGIGEQRRRRRSTTISWLDRIASAFLVTKRSKRQILSNLPGNWTWREEEDAEENEPDDAETPPPEKEDTDDNEKSSIEGDADSFNCYKLVFANQRDELEEFRGCVLTTLFDVCDLFINYNDKSRKRVVFCELCHKPLVDKEHPPCNDASISNTSRLTLVVALLWIYVNLPLCCTPLRFMN